MVPGEDVARAKSELPLSDEDSLGKSTLQRLRTNPGADVVIMGSYMMLPTDPKRRIRLDVRVQDTAGGDTSRRSPYRARRTTSSTWSRIWVENCGEVSVWLHRLRGSKLPHEQLFRLMKRQPASTPRDEQDCGHSTTFAARDLLNGAIAADPDFPLAHAALSDVWWHTGYDAKARAEARRALELSNHLSQEQQLLVEGQYQRTVEEWPKAVETYRSLFRLFPDNLDYGLLFASAQMHLSAADSLQTLAVLRQLPPPLGDDARIDMTEASAWINRDFTKATCRSEASDRKSDGTRITGYCQSNVRYSLSARTLYRRIH